MKAVWFVPAVLAVGLLAAGPLLARLHVVSPFAGVMTCGAAALPGLVSTILGLVLLLKRRRGAGWAALLIGLAPFAVVAAVCVRAGQLPAVSDISTNLDNPPVFVAAAQEPENVGRDLSYPESVKALVQSAYPGLISLQLPLAPEVAFQLVRRVASARPSWTITRVDVPALTVEGREASGVFQFTDDFVIRLLPLDRSTQVDMRSRSRILPNDFGTNADRIAFFFAALEAAAKSAP